MWGLKPRLLVAEAFPYMAETSAAAELSLNNPELSLPRPLPYQLVL